MSASISDVVPVTVSSIVLPLILLVTFIFFHRELFFASLVVEIVYIRFIYVVNYIVDCVSVASNYEGKV